jgi:nitric oxide reductase subunit B
MFIMHATRKLWTWLAVICALSFAVLGWVGTEIYLTAPPIPKQVSSTEGKVLFSEGQVQRGQEAWLSAGGQQLGSVWGHGSYVAPDWSADWLHREALALRAIWAQRDFKQPFEQLSRASKPNSMRGSKTEMRRNTYDATTGTLTLSRPSALRRCSRWCSTTWPCLAMTRRWTSCASSTR